MSFTSFLSDRQGPSHSDQQTATSAELFQSTSFQSTASPSSSSSTPPSASASAAAPTASDLFATSAFDPARLHPLAGLGDNLDYLLLDEDKVADLPGGQSALPSRGWTDELCYGTGTTYVSGLVLGGMWGFKEGMSRPLGTSNSWKLRINSILNGCTRRGSFLGNSAGILALFYNGVNSSIDAFRGHHDIMGGMAAGAISGAMFKATAGVRSAVVSATLMMAASGTWAWAKKTLL